MRVMEITLQDNGQFLVKLNEEEWETLKEVQSLMKDCSEKFDESVSLGESLQAVIEAGFVWLDS